MLAGMDLTGELAANQVPGAGDRRRDSTAAARRHASSRGEGHPGARFKVLPTGHYAGVQTPELVAAEIGAFLPLEGWGA
jgi:hypothetical protein